MNYKRHTKKWIIIALGVLAIIPVMISIQDIIFTENKSVVFLGDYSPNLTFLVISYYILILGLGLVWFTRLVIFIARLKNEKIKVELMLLKSQVSPHFFFNMLNNLYGLVHKDTSKAQELILKLSDVMRYSIYEGEKETVTLQEEIDYLKNYIELHKMRYHKYIAIDFNCIIDKNHEVSPLLFIILLENAFKHGVENLTENAYVKIDITSVENNIKFTIKNNFEGSDNQENKSGIGLGNLRRRLELIYPNKHKLSFSITENEYSAELTLVTI